MSYQPNPKNKAFIRRANLALEFVDKYVHSTPNFLSSTWIENPQHFGSHRNELSAWLKQQLLICVDPHFNYLTGKCKKYIRNPAGYKELIDLLKGKIVVSAEQQQQLDTGNFPYNNQSDRSFTSAQYIPRYKRNSILNNNGYRYHYDIEATAPTLLVQRARTLNPNLTIPSLEYYMNNRSEVRQRIAVACFISEEQVKAVINSILQGGTISPWDQNKIFNKILSRSYSAVRLLNTNSDISDLKRDINNLWDILRVDIPVRYKLNKQGLTVPVRVNAKEKASVYRALETQVARPIRKYLNKQSLRYLWLHDGWSCDQGVEPIEIVQVVRRQTGYVIKLDWTIYEE